MNEDVKRTMECVTQYIKFGYKSAVFSFQIIHNLLCNHQHGTLKFTCIIIFKPLRETYFSRCSNLTSCLFAHAIYFKAIQKNHLHMSIAH